MDLWKPSFWVDRLLFLATTYILIAYIFSPSSNKCQMTFMMEPPTFIPIPIHDTITKSLLDSSTLTKYKLYMYSEIGFPEVSNVQRDVKDSMPVLFIPGNAGSYQQVRSLASTCIRHQLQSLNSYKFIFYTIDFNEELSGISGQLIQDETKFVHAALKQIAKIHPEETGGIIVIGHSVGGFISKNLFTLPHFDPNSVPLVISLASPLIKPYLAFDDEMTALYARTNYIWEKEMGFKNNTISISISGGDSDKLVPKHLSMDSSYDLFLTTSAIRGVWLDTDHVCITWCRELMHKLSKLLSSLMDRKNTNIIKDKREALSIVRNQLLTLDEPPSIVNEDVISIKDWKSSKPYQIVEINAFKQFTRSELSNHIVILKTDKLLGTDLLITIDHINELTPGRVFKCFNLQMRDDDSRFECFKRVDLIDYSYLLSTKRNEPKKTAIKIDLDKASSDESLVFDFYSGVEKNYEMSNKSPERLTIQEVYQKHEETLYIPTFLELLMDKVLFMNSYDYEIEGPVRELSVLTRYRLVNLIHETQIFYLELESANCRDGYPNHSGILLYQGQYLSQSFHPQEILAKNNQVNEKVSFTFDFRVQQSVIMRDVPNPQNYYLDFHIDGTCKNKLTFRPNFAGLSILCLHRNLSRIIALTTYLLIISIIDNTLNIINISHTYEYTPLLSSSGVLKSLGFFAIYFLHQYSSTEIRRQIIDQSIFFLTISILSYGLGAILKHIFHQLVNVSTIIYNLQSFIQHRLLATKSLLAGTTTSKESPKERLGSTSSKVPVEQLELSKFKFDHMDWILVWLSIVASMFLSPAISFITQILFVIKTKFILNLSKQNQNIGNLHLPEITQPKEIKFAYEVEKLVANIAIFCSIAFISSIPEALIRIKTGDLNIVKDFLDFRYKDLPFILSNLSLVMIKTNCDKLSNLKPSSNIRQKADASSNFIEVLMKFMRKFGYVLIFLPVLQMKFNLSYVRMALASTLLWLYLNLIQNDYQTKNSTNERKVKDLNQHLRN